MEKYVGDKIWKNIEKKDMEQKIHRDKYLHWRKTKYRGMEIHKKHNGEKENNANSGNIT
jgi:KaiC/GvpD/RAD55 family RecA-like ATPase